MPSVATFPATISTRFSSFVPVLAAWSRSPRVGGGATLAISTLPSPEVAAPLFFTRKMGNGESAQSQIDHQVSQSPDYRDWAARLGRIDNELFEIIEVMSFWAQTSSLDSLTRANIQDNMSISSIVREFQRVEASHDALEIILDELAERKEFLLDMKEGREEITAWLLQRGASGATQDEWIVMLAKILCTVETAAEKLPSRNELDDVRSNL